MEKFQDLNLCNSFLFAATLEDPETSQMILELFLEEEVGHVRVRAEMDLSSLKPGQDFNDLKSSVVVFICAFDPFGRELYRYTFEEHCKEADFLLGDGTKKIFLNTKGKNKEDVPEALVHFLEYVEDSTDQYVNQVNDKVVQRLHQKLKTLKQDRELEGRYMQFEELLERNRRAGREEGREEGHKEHEVELIMKKAKKNLPVAAIAEFLEVPEAFVEEVCNLIRENPEAGVEELCQLLQEEK